MKKQDILSILITFVVGFFAGGYLYVTSFAPLASKVTVPSAERASAFTIVSEVYGGCRSECPSFQVVSDGGYRYLHTVRAGEDQVLQRGTLPLNIQRNLKARLSEGELELQSQETSPALCNSFTDGIDVRYEITLEGTEYVLDTCGTNVDSASSLWQTLDGVWEYLEGPRNSGA